MRSTNEQHLIEWTSVHPTRPVVVDLTEDDHLESGEAPEAPVSQEVEARMPALSQPRPKSEADAEPSSRLDCLSREQLLDEIISANPSATVSFLNEFGDRGLRRYLARLRSCSMGRGRSSVLEREAESPAIVARMRIV